MIYGFFVLGVTEYWCKMVGLKWTVADWFSMAFCCWLSVFQKLLMSVKLGSKAGELSDLCTRLARLNVELTELLNKNEKIPYAPQWFELLMRYINRISWGFTRMFAKMKSCIFCC